MGTSDPQNETKRCTLPWEIEQPFRSFATLKKGKGKKKSLCNYFALDWYTVRVLSLQNTKEGQIIMKCSIWQWLWLSEESNFPWIYQNKANPVRGMCNIATVEMQPGRNIVWPKCDKWVSIIVRLYFEYWLPGKTLRPQPAIFSSVSKDHQLSSTMI